MTRVVPARFCFLLALISVVPRAAAENRQVTFTGAQLGEARWTGGLMGQRFETCRSVTLPAMLRLMDGTEPAQFLQNFRIAAGLAEGRHRGPRWNDGDFFKCLEAAAAVYAVSPDEDLDKQMDEAIAIVARAQRPDGYLHTPVLIKLRAGEPARPLTDPLDFELYNMGHLFTAACVHHQATSKSNLLAVARRAADYLCVAFADPTPELARLGVCPAHYMGLVELYRTTGERKYLDLARRLFDLRDRVQNGTDDNQDRIPFCEQTTATGHAVRANYLYAGAADIYAETGDAALLRPLQAIWSDVITHKLYITGGCGALYDGASPDGSPDQKQISRVHQAYGRDYQLPNLAAHNETCAAVGLLLWNWRMLQITGEARFADVIEQTLYNSVLTGVSADGRTFFYANPLRSIDPTPIALRWSRSRQPFISVFCCPPNVLRTIAESSTLAYGKSDRRVWVNLYGASRFQTTLSGSALDIVQETKYPWDGNVRLLVKAAGSDEFSLLLRIPGWSSGAVATLNGKPLDAAVRPGTYLELRRRWSAGEVIELNIPMPARLVEANPLVEEARNQVAAMRGPLVYCIESPDLPQGVRPMAVRVARDAKLTSSWDGNTAGGIMNIGAAASAESQADWGQRLYRDVAAAPKRQIDLKLIPYFAWANRGKSEMTVWMCAGD